MKYLQHTFTGAWLKHLDPKKHQSQTQYTDSRSAARLRVYPPSKKNPHGKIVLNVSYTLDGKKTSKSFPDDPKKLGLTKIRELADELVLNAKKGLDPRSAERAKTESFTHHQLIEEYKRVELPKLRSGTERMRLLEKDIEAWADKKLVTVDRRQVTLLIDAIAERAPRTAGLFQSYLFRLYEFGLERGILDVNPMAGMRQRNQVVKRERILSETELVDFWHNLDALPRVSPSTKLALRLVLLTGCRPSEAVTAECRELTDDRSAWSIPAAKTKTQEARTLPLPGVARELLEPVVCDKKRDFVCAGKDGKPPRRDTLSKMLLRHGEALGCPGVRPHDLRRTYRSVLAKIGADYLASELLLGHTMPGVAGIYIRDDLADLKNEAVEKFDAYFVALLAGESA